MMDADVVVIGGGVIGASIAFNLAERGAGTIVLVERDSPGAGSTSKAAGGVRCQFSDEVNIALSARSLEILRRFDADFGVDIGLVSNGYLFLLDSEADAAAFERNVALQQQMGLDSRMLTVAEAADLAPYVETGGLIAGAYNPDDGHCTPEAVVAGYISAARARGVTVLSSCEVTGITTVETTAGRAVSAVETTTGTIGCGRIVCAAGAWSGLIGQMAGVDLPVTPLRREIMVSEPVDFDTSGMPFTIEFSTGYYVHPEGRGLLFGCPDAKDRRTFDDRRDPDWPLTLSELIAARTPSLGDVAVKRGWAGLYEMTPDHNALIGHSLELDGFFYACGFSGHGFLMGPAVGEVVSDLVTGHAPFVDVAPLGTDRFTTSGLRKELNIV